MKQTKKYSGACEIATLNHSNQEDLYYQLNGLGFYWNSKTQVWERNDQLAKPASKIIKIRVWTATEHVDRLAAATIEGLEAYGLQLVEISSPYVCRPPQQNDSRIYLSFTDTEPEI